MSTDADTWIRCYHQAPDSKAQLVCFPHAGGSASFFFPVSATLSPAIKVSAIQYPGRQDRRGEPCIEDIRLLADAIFPEVRALADDRPLAFFGHSMGAVVAYEVARRMEQDGMRPLARLYVSGRRAPSCYRPESVHTRDDDGVIAEIRELSGTNPELLGDLEMLDMILPAIRSDYRAIENYRDTGDRPVSAPVTAIIGDSDPKVTIEEAMAWAEHSEGPFDLHVLPGGHFYLIEQSQHVMRIIGSDLDSIPAMAHADR
jgi:surfactin synthase thioesterase subunit